MADGTSGSTSHRMRYLRQANVLDGRAAAQTSSSKRTRSGQTLGSATKVAMVGLGVAGAVIPGAGVISAALGKIAGGFGSADSGGMMESMRSQNMEFSDGSSDSSRPPPAGLTAMQQSSRLHALLTNLNRKGYVLGRQPGESGDDDSGRPSASGPTIATNPYTTTHVDIAVGGGGSVADDD